jgi:hypothetical protein
MGKRNAVLNQSNRETNMTFSMRSQLSCNVTTCPNDMCRTKSECQHPPLAYRYPFDDADSIAPQRKRLIDADSVTRKTFPMAAGLLDYFPDALAAVANVSFQGNEKHNPGEPIHHARGKSMDHADCIMRHLVGRGGFDGDMRESAALAWRALALLQEELEKEFNLPLPRGAR